MVPFILGWEVFAVSAIKPRCAPFMWSKHMLLAQRGSCGWMCLSVRMSQGAFCSGLGSVCFVCHETQVCTFQVVQAHVCGPEGLLWGNVFVGAHGLSYWVGKCSHIKVGLSQHSSLTDLSL